ncbi:MAG TPA: hypothetical protein VFC38_09105 [Stellaceae bacterium]|nr:hypothetical protein [Stellaceae bacterium]
MPDQPGDILNKLGISGEALDRVRFARGVVGNTTYAICAALAAIAAVAFSFSSHPGVAELLILVIVGVVSLYLLGTWIFSHLNPGLALLGGAELLKWRQMEMGAKGMTILPEEVNVSLPKKIAPPPEA